MYAARDYQVAFHDAVLREWGHSPWWDGERAVSQKTIGDMATSAGKTICAAMLAETLTEKIGGRMLFVADREELIQQPVEKFHKACGIISSIERGQDRASMHSKVVITSVQTMSRQNRLDRYPRDHFTHIIDDEAHRNTEARAKIHAHFSSAKVLGITATPFRAGLADLSKWYSTVAFELGTFDLIDQGYITPVKVLTVPLEVDLTQVKQKSGDYDQQQVESVMRPYYPAIAQIIKEHAANRTILAFLPLISSSKEFVEVMRGEGLTAMHCDGGSPDRKEIKEGFERGEFQILSNSQVFSTGVDFIRCDCLLNLAPTRSRVEYRQRAGRIMRLIPGTIDPGGVTLPTAEERRAAIAGCVKPDTLILDLLWQTAKIGLAGPASLIAFSEEDEEEIKERVKKQRTPEELSEISQKVRVDRETKLRKALEEAAREKQQREHRRASMMDARQMVLNLHERELSDYVPVLAWERQKPTHWSKEALIKHGIDPEGVSAGLASKLIDSINGRQRRGLAPLEAFAQLRAAGVEEPEKCTLDHAIVVLRDQFPCTFGKKFHNVPLCKVPRSFWSWLMYDEGVAATQSRERCAKDHPSTWRYLNRVIFPAQQPELV